MVERYEREQLLAAEEIQRVAQAKAACLEDEIRRDRRDAAVRIHPPISLSRRVMINCKMGFRIHHNYKQKYNDIEIQYLILHETAHPPSSVRLEHRRVPFSRFHQARQIDDNEQVFILRQRRIFSGIFFTSLHVLASYLPFEQCQVQLAMRQHAAQRRGEKKGCRATRVVTPGP